MKRNPSINDLERFDCLKLTERQQLWGHLVEDWETPRDLADWIVWRLAAADVALQGVKKQVADLEADIEAREFR
jgi:hypothetical protein